MSLCITRAKPAPPYKFHITDRAAGPRLNIPWRHFVRILTDWPSTQAACFCDLSPPSAPRFRRLSYISDARPRNPDSPSSMRSETESGDRMRCSRFHEEPNRLAADPVRLILRPFGPLAPRFHRLSYIPDTSPLYLDLALGMRSAAEPGDRIDFPRFPEYPSRLVVDQGRGIAPQSRLVFADFRTFRATRLLISPLLLECVRWPNPTIARISRDFLKILTNWPSIRVAWFWWISPHAGLFCADFRTLRTRHRCFLNGGFVFVWTAFLFPRA